MSIGPGHRSRRQARPSRLCCAARHFPGLSFSHFDRDDFPHATTYAARAHAETRHFWDGCREGELRLQRCTDCDGGSYFPPRPFCPKCGSRNVEAYRASGRAVLWSYVINHRPRPDMGTEPHSIAVVQLEEGPRMMTNVVGCPQTPEALKLDMALKVTFAKQNDDISLPLFEPAEG